MKPELAKTFLALGLAGLLYACGGGDGSSAETSAPDTIQVTANGASFWLSNPGTLSQGATATLQAVVGVVPPTGSVSFTINGAPIATNVPVNAQGIAQTRWTPPAPGNFTLSASWVGNGGQQGSASEVLNVSAAPAVSDTIVVRDGSGNVLNPATPVTVANGVTVPFTTQTSSGAAVQLTEAGPCQLNGNTLTATQGNGQCRVTAASPGGNGYGPATAVYTVSLVPGTQVPNTNVPVSGRVNRNTTITLERGNRSGTNANQDISWRVTEGRNVCQLRFPSNGNVNLRTVRSGTCTVRGTAPAVAGQWNRMVINRTYRVR